MDFFVEKGGGSFPPGSHLFSGHFSVSMWNFSPWTPKPWKMKVLQPQNVGYNPKKWRLWVPMVGCIYQVCNLLTTRRFMKPHRDTQLAVESDLPQAGRGSPWGESGYTEAAAFQWCGGFWETGGWEVDAKVWYFWGISFVIPWKLTWHWKITIFNRKYIVMLVFRGGSALFEFVMGRFVTSLS